MIEYYQFKHNGGQESYKDGIFLSIVPHMTFLVFYGSNMETGSSEVRKTLSSIFQGKDMELGFEELDKKISESLPSGSEYMLIRISKDSIQCSRYGGVEAKIVMGGEMRQLSNGFFGLSSGDRIVLGTASFFSFLSDEAILADALVSGNCSEWMNYMVRRISDINELSCGNLTALTLILRD